MAASVSLDGRVVCRRNRKQAQHEGFRFRENKTGLRAEKGMDIEKFSNGFTNLWNFENYGVDYLPGYEGRRMITV